MKRTIQSVLLEALIIVAAAHISSTNAESRNFNTGYGFGAPINVGGESVYGLGNSYSGGSSNSASGYGLGHGYSGYLGISNGFGFSGNNGLGYGTGSSSFPGLHSYNHFAHSTVPQNSGFYPNTGFGNNFYPGSGYFGSNFGGYGINRPFGIGAGPGGNGLHGANGFSNSIGNGITNGYGLGTGYTPIGSNFGSNPVYGNHYGSGLGYGLTQPFK